MTTQHRVLRGQYPQSQSQPIPQRFGNPQQPQFNAGQAYSPRHQAPPSSSPLHQHQQFYPPAQHDMFKGPGVGTPPTMMGMPQPQQQQQQQYYMNGGQRPRVPHQTIPVRSSIYYGHGPPMVRGYPNVPPPPQQYFSPSPGVSQYPMMQSTHASMQQQPAPMYSQPGYPPQYTQAMTPVPHQSLPQVTHPGKLLQPQPGSLKREKKLIKIVDPTTNQDITDDIMRSNKTDSTSTPPSGRSSVTGTPPTSGGDVAAKFAAQVAAAAGTIKNPGVLDTSAIPIGVNPAYMQQEQLVGSPNIPGQMAVYGSPYMTAASPRPQMIQPGQFQQEPMNHQPGHIVLSQNQMQPMGMPLSQPQVQQPYQLPSQRFPTPASHPLPPSSNIPENVHTFPVSNQPKLTPGQVQIARPPVVKPTPSPPPVVLPPQKDDTQEAVTEQKDTPSLEEPEPVPSETPSTVDELQNGAATVVNDQASEHVSVDGSSQAENVPSTPEDSKQETETEDTAIRLENADVQPEVVETEEVKPTVPTEVVDSVPLAEKESVSDVTPLKDDPSPSLLDSEEKEKSTPIPSGKAYVNAVSTALEDSIALPEKEAPIKTATVESPAPVKANGEESVSVEANKQQKPQTVSEQEPPTHVAVNGVASDTSDTPADLETSQKSKPDAPAQQVVEEVSSKVRDPSQSNEKTVANKISDKSNGDSSKTKSAKEINYPDEEQWSPANQQGKRQYDSSFLLQFQYRASALAKPKDLPNIDCVLEQPHKKIAAPMQPMEINRGGSDFTPHYMNRDRPRDRRMGRQNSKDHRPYGRQPHVIPKKVVSIDRDVELKTTANAWKPIKRDAGGKMSQEDLETLTVERDVRVILNKITPTTFKELMQQIPSLKIDTEKKLRRTIDLIFEKAIDEPNFSEAYANMCRQMTQIRVTPEALPENPNPTGQVEFRKLLLTKCQREFERDKSDREHLQELKKRMEANTDTELAPQLKEEYDTAEFKDRRRTLGNIRFIGELFKLRMLTEPIMHSCIMTLFKAKDDDHLESLCRLLTTIGKDLDTPKAKQRLDQYFDQIKKIIAEKRTSSRVRFMLQDVNDLRSNNWVPRAIQTQGPKTVSQIRQDAKNEQEMLQLKLATTPTPAIKQGSRGQNRMNNRGGHEDGWTKVQTPKPTRFDPSKMKLQKTNVDETKVTLGPSRGFGGWKSGSAGSSITKTGSSGYSPSSSMDRTLESGPRSNTPTSMMNRFSALQGSGPDHEYQRRQGGRPGSREGSRSGSRGSMGPPSSNSGGRTPRRDERTSLLEATRKITSADRSQESRQRSSRESSPSVPKPRPATPQQAEPAHKYNMDLDEEKMQQKSRSILEEFLSIVDFKEATECIEELNAPPTLMYALVYVGHEFTLEKKGVARNNIGRLMAHLLKRGRLSVEQYVKGLAELLEMATDYEIDVPKVWEYFAEQMAPVFSADNDSEISLTVLGTLAAPLLEEDKSGVFVIEIIKQVLKDESLESFVARWRKSNLLWSKITGKNEESVRNFLGSHKLEALDDSDGQSPQTEDTTSSVGQNKLNDRYRLEKDVTELLNKGLSNDDIFDWVEKTLSPEDAHGPDFVRALTISVCKRSLNRDKNDQDKMTLDEEKISERSILLNKYIENRPERELQVLYALQNLMVELDQPRDVLRKFFDIFYNEDVVQEQTFYNWETSDDPNEQEGRGVAVASVNMFFTWLRTAEPESD